MGIAGSDYVGHSRRVSATASQDEFLRELGDVVVSLRISLSYF
jgi:hypothetical protein